jgi:predicted DNA-binding WGR domain protein
LARFGRNGGRGQIMSCHGFRYDDSVPEAVNKVPQQDMRKRLKRLAREFRQRS